MADRRPKDIGTADETAVVRALQPLGFPHAERRALRGINDCGDITGIPGVMIEVKGGRAGRTASDNQIGEWMRGQVDPQTTNGQADLGFLVTPRIGVGPANAARWWAHLWLSDLQWLATGDAWSTADIALIPPAVDCIARITLHDTTRLLRYAGYGTPLGRESTP